MPKRMGDYKKSDYDEEIRRRGKDIDDFSKDCRRRIGEHREELKEGFESSHRIHEHHRNHCGH